MHPLSHRITDLQRRLAHSERATAACRIAVVAITAALVLGLLDYVVRYNDRGLRILATATFAAVVLWAIHRWWYRNRRQLTPLVVARQVETQFPQLHDSLASAVEFLEQDENDATAGSAQLRRIVIADVQTAIEELPLENVIDHGPLRQSAGWLVAVLLIVALLVFWNVSLVGTAVARLGLPLGRAEWPRQHYLVFRGVPERLAAGQTFEVELVDTAGRLPDEVIVEYRVIEGGKKQRVVEAMERAGDTMIARRENVRGSFSFRAHGGDDNTMPWHQVEVVEPPEVESISITTHPPTYTGLPTKPAERHLEVLEGTGIEVSGTASEPLRGARILRDGAEPIVAVIGEDLVNRNKYPFHVLPKVWIADRSGPYRLELTGEDGAASVVAQGNLRVLPDPPPTASWQQPTSDFHVTTAAQISIALKVKDNLAIRQVDLTYERSDLSESERERQKAPPRIELYGGPEQAPQLGSSVDRALGEEQLVEFLWDLSPLALPAGAHLTIKAEASDYRPGIAQAAGALRITIITADEFAQRLAERQTQIVGQLERALAVQRATRETVRGIEMQSLETTTDGQIDSKRIQSAEVNQLRVSRTLVDEAEGVPALIAGLLSEIEMNRVEEAELIVAMNRLSAELQRLRSGPLDQADRELTAARKTLETALPQDARKVSQSLTVVGAAQDEVIAALERLIDEFSGTADFGRIIRLLMDLRLDQLASEESTRASLSADTRSLRVEELNRAQRAKLEQAAIAQHALATRYEKIERGMDQLAQEVTDAQLELTSTLSNAVQLARQLGVGATMRVTAQDLSANRVGQALVRQPQIADELQQLLDILQTSGDHQPLAEGLRDAERRLAELRKRVAALRDEAARLEKPATSPIDGQHAEVDREQQKVRGEIEQLAKQLERLQANEASRSTQSAANRLNSKQPGNPPARASDQVKQAEDDLEQAANQLAQRRQQAEDDLVLEMVRRFQAELGQMVDRQKRVIERTMDVDRSRGKAQKPESIRKELSELAAEEQALSDLAREHSEMLFGLAPVRVSLEDAEQRLSLAAKLLQTGKTDLATQAAEQLALARLQAMAETFAETAAKAAQPPNPAAPPAPPPAAGQQPQRRPTFELLEVKMLRMLQAELRDRTRAHEERLAKFNGPPPEAERTDLDREARELAAEQGRLAELVQNMLNRNNSP